MSESWFKFPEHLLRVKSLRCRLISALESSDDEKVRALVADVPRLRESKHGDARDAATLTIGFVGQYNAGKSTIISALTGERDIPIDADVCTDKVTAYDWQDIRLLDTPGIHAGYRDHDELTYKTIDRSDLLVFVITNEMFDNIIGEHFRSLAFARNKAQEILLVVNKMGQAPGSADTKRRDLEKVTSPLSIKDFRTTFIDALSYIDALNETDTDDRNELFEIAAFDDFVAAMNGFVEDRGLMGRLTTPLFGIRSIARDGEAYLAVDMPEEHAVLELLRRKRQLLVSSRTRLTDALDGLLAEVASDVVRYGDEVAVTIEPGSTEASVTHRHEEAQRHAQQRYSRFSDEAKTTVEAELRDLSRQLEALENSVLARKLLSQVDAERTRAMFGSDDGERPEVGWQPRQWAEPSDWLSRLDRIGDVAKTLGKSVASWTTGPSAEVAKIGSATAARGSQGHKAIYGVGKFFGINFRPWGAVKVARILGNVGRIIAAIAAVLAVVAQVVEDLQNEEQRRQLLDARDSVRNDYRKYVRAVEGAFRSRVKEFAEDFYGSELLAVDETVSDIVGQRKARGSTAETLGELRREATRFIESIQSASA